MLPTLLYEMLPIICLFFGTLLLNMAHGFLLLFSAVLLFWAGAIMWMMRSEYRRTDDQNIIVHTLLFFPELLYEILPFIHLFIGIILLRNTQQPYFMIAGGMLILWALYCATKRYVYRCHVYRPIKFKDPKTHIKQHI